MAKAETKRAAKPKKSKGPYSLTSPCGKCPFRTDVLPFLRKARVLEIQRTIERGEFFCHETVARDNATGENVTTGQEVNCAGALILLEKLEQPSQMMRISERLGFYDRTKLNMDAPVFDTFEDMIEAQTR